MSTEPGPVPAFRTATRSFVLELTRRWMTLLFMLLMPSAFFVTMYFAGDDAGLQVALPGERGAVLVPDRAAKAIYLTMLGIGVAGSFSALASLKDKMPLFRRLRLIGFPTAALLGARLVVLALIVAASTVLFTVLLVALVPVHSIAVTVAGATLVGLVGVGLGTALALLLNREFEASMILIAVSGMQMALGRSGASAEEFLPFWPAVRLLEAGVFDLGGNPLRYLAQGSGYVAALLLFSYAVWQRRTTPRSAPSAPRHRRDRRETAAAAVPPGRIAPAVTATRETPGHRVS